MNELKIKILNLINEFMNSNEDSLIHENEIETEFQEESRLLIKCKRLDEVEHDMFKFLSNLKNNSSENQAENTLFESAFIESIRFTPVFDGILIYIAE